MHVISIAG